VSRVDSLTPEPIFSPQVITAVAEVITGGSGSGGGGKRYGAYRTGPQLETFFGACNVDLQIGSGSRVPTVRGCLIELNRRGAFESLKRLTEASVDPRDYVGNQPEHKETLQHLNDMLRPDGFELRERNGRYRLEAVSTSPAILMAVEEHATALDYDSVQRDAERAVEQAATDPEGAITATCSMVESVCRCILQDMKQPLPAKKDISHLVSEVQRHLDLSPARTDLAADLKQILGGLSNVASGVGSLRTHAGDAHGRDKGAMPADGRLARLAIHAASTLSLFFIETWREQNWMSDL
jgi:hypothetical protein